MCRCCVVCVQHAGMKYMCGCCVVCEQYAGMKYMCHRCVVRTVDIAIHVYMCVWRVQCWWWMCTEVLK